MISIAQFLLESLDDWKQSSIKKFGNTIGKSAKSEGFFDKCKKRMQSKPGFGSENASGFCAKIIDKAKGTTDWRTGSDGK